MAFTISARQIPAELLTRAIRGWHHEEAADRVITSVDAKGGSGSADIWTVGSREALHWNGSTWSLVTTGAEVLFGVWGSGPKDVWAVGSGGTILHYGSDH